jgi:hypothetical protein
LTLKWGVRDATAYLLERTGAIAQATAQLFQIVEDSIKKFITNTYISPSVTVTYHTLESQLDADFGEVLALLMRNRSLENDAEWFSLMRSVIGIGEYLDSVTRSIGTKRDIKRI